MSSHDVESDKQSGLATGAFWLILGLGFLFGWGFGRDNARSGFEDWAVNTTRQCEGSYKADGYSSVTECLKDVIKNGEDERREEAEAEAGDSR